MRFDRYFVGFLDRPGKADTERVRIFCKAPVIISTALAQASEGPVESHEGRNHDIWPAQLTCFIGFGNIAKSGYQRVDTGNQPKLKRIVICDAWQCDTDADFRQIFDQALRRRFRADAPIKCHCLIGLDQARQWRGKATERQIAACAVQLTNKIIAPPSILFAQLLLILFQDTQKIYFLWKSDGTILVVCRKIL